MENKNIPNHQPGVVFGHVFPELSRACQCQRWCLASLASQHKWARCLAWLASQQKWAQTKFQEDGPAEWSHHDVHKAEGLHRAMHLQKYFKGNALAESWTASRTPYLLFKLESEAPAGCYAFFHIPRTYTLHPERVACPVFFPLTGMILGCCEQLLQFWFWYI